MPNGPPTLIAGESVEKPAELVELEAPVDAAAGHISGV
jgi:hypothetical protein